ncbi:MAG TPA: metalloregulator ArsR/SmtB family transcription factor [Polyangiaceae bacterium]
MSANQLQLDALGDATRRAIFERLARGPRSVAEIADGLPVSRPAVSQHLKVLREARLVRVRSEGTRNYYEVEAAGLEALRKWLDRFWDRALGAFKEAAETAQREKDKS